MSDVPWLQTLSFIAVSQWVTVYLVAVRPYESIYQNMLEMMNELIVLLLGYHMVVLAAFYIPIETR